MSMHLKLNRLNFYCWIIVCIVVAILGYVMYYRLPNTVFALLGYIIITVLSGYFTALTLLVILMIKAPNKVAFWDNPMHPVLLNPAWLLKKLTFGAITFKRSR